MLSPVEPRRLPPTRRRTSGSAWAANKATARSARPVTSDASSTSSENSTTGGYAAG